MGNLGFTKIKLNYLLISLTKRINKCPTESVKYLGVKIDINLSWRCQVNYFSMKLKRANTVLFKIRKNVSPKILRFIYFSIFDSNLSYCSLVWAQNRSTIQRILKFQDQNFVLKFQNKICLENKLFVSKPLNNLSVHGLVFLQINITMHLKSRQGNVIKSSYKKNRYGKYSIIANSLSHGTKFKKSIKMQYTESSIPH